MMSTNVLEALDKQPQNYLISFDPDREPLSLSVVIPAYEHLEKVLVCLNSLQAFAIHKNQYIVSDDASPNTLYPALLPPCLAEVYRQAINGGFCVNVNAGARQAKGDILLLLNQDVFAVAGFSDGWDAALLAAFDNPAVGIVGVRLLFPDGKRLTHN